MAPSRDGVRCTACGHWTPGAFDGPYPDVHILDLIAWATQHLHEDLSLQRMANRLYVSRRSLSRRFRAQTGTTPYAWVLEQRIQRARDLLADPRGLSVQTVARRVGFATAALLRLHFRRAVGCTPSEFRAGAHLATDIGRTGAQSREASASMTATTSSPP